jgi:hypothetical protein
MEITAISSKNRHDFQARPGFRRRPLSVATGRSLAVFRCQLSLPTAGQCRGPSWGSGGIVVGASIRAASRRNRSSTFSPCPMSLYKKSFSYSVATSELSVHAHLCEALRNKDHEPAEVKTCSCRLQCTGVRRQSVPKCSSSIETGLQAQHRPVQGESGRILRGNVAATFPDRRPRLVDEPVLLRSLPQCRGCLPRARRLSPQPRTPRHPNRSLPLKPVGPLRGR